MFGTSPKAAVVETSQIGSNRERERENTEGGSRVQGYRIGNQIAISEPGQHQRMLSTRLHRYAQPQARKHAGRHSGNRIPVRDKVTTSSLLINDHFRLITGHWTKQGQRGHMAWTVSQPNQWHSSVFSQRCSTIATIVNHASM